MMNDERARDDEERRMRQLRFLVAVTTAVLKTRPLTPSEAEEVIAELRRRVLDLFPGKEAVFDLIYPPRFHRILRDRRLLPRQEDR